MGEQSIRAPRISKQLPRSFTHPYPWSPFSLRIPGAPPGRALLQAGAVGPNHVFLEHPNSDLSTQRTQRFAEPLGGGFLEQGSVLKLHAGACVPSAFGLRRAENWRTPGGPLRLPLSRTARPKRGVLSSRAKARATAASV